MAALSLKPTNLFSPKDQQVTPSSIGTTSNILQSQARALQQAQRGGPTTGYGVPGESQQELPGLGDLVSKAMGQQDKQQIMQLQQTTAESGVQQQHEQQSLDLQQKSVTVRDQFAQQTEDLLQKFEQQKDLLDLDHYAAETAQLQFVMRMQNDKYIDQLKLEGARNRLDDSNKFALAMQESIFSDETTLLKSSLAFKQLLNSDNLAAQGKLADDQRSFQKQLGEMDLELALQITLADSDARNTALAYSSIGKMLEIGGKGAYSWYKGASTETAPDIELE